MCVSIDLRWLQLPLQYSCSNNSIWNYRECIPKCFKRCNSCTNSPGYYAVVIESKPPRSVDCSVKRLFCWSPWISVVTAELHQTILGCRLMHVSIVHRSLHISLIIIIIRMNPRQCLRWCYGMVYWLQEFCLFTRREKAWCTLAIDLDKTEPADLNIQFQLPL